MNNYRQQAKITSSAQNFNFLTKLFFLHTRQIFLNGLKKHITRNDIYPIESSYKSEFLGNKIQKQWKKQRSKNQSSLWLLIWKCFGIEYLLLSFWLISITSTTTYLQPQVFKKFLSHFASNDATPLNGWLYGISLILILFVKFTCIINAQFRYQVFALKIQSGLTYLIYQEILNSNSLKVNSKSGKIVTLITRDVNEITTALLSISSIFRDSINIFVVCLVLYLEIGWISLVVPCIISTIILTQVFVAILVWYLKRKSLQESDQRYQITKEVLSAIKLIKIYNWIQEYYTKICTIRKKEANFISNIYFLLQLKINISDSVLNGIWYLLIVISIWRGMQPSAGVMFLLMTSINSISDVIKFIFPVGINKFANMVATFHRIENFLVEIETKTNKKNKTENKNITPIIIIENLEISDSSKVILSSLNIKITTSVVTAITGSIGSGKSLLLKVIAKEYQTITGNLTINGTISYASQEPWLFPSTIKQNILFGSDFDKKRYFEVLKVCALLEDLYQMKNHDETIISDRGLNLSKGQQVRINLARAVYRNSDIYLLDDCLANLDVIVADFIFEKCFKQFLKNKIVILVTQNDRYICKSKNVISLLNSTSNFRVNSVTDCFDKIKFDSYVGISGNNENMETNVDESTKLLRKSNNQVYFESQPTERVKLKIYKKYVEATGSKILSILFICSLVLIQILKSIMDKLQANWITTEQQIFRNTTKPDDYKNAITKRYQLYYIYPCLLCGSIILVIFNIRLYWRLAYKVSKNLHKLVLSKVLNASMRFFDNHLLGNILNRFSEDLMYIDERIPNTFLLTLNIFLNAIGSIMLVATVNLYLLLAAIILTVIVIFTRIFYLRVGEALKRLELSAHSPLIGHTVATVDGLPTIKIFKTQNLLLQEFSQHLDSYTATSYLYESCEKAFRFVLCIYSVFFMLVEVIFFLNNSRNENVGNIALVLIQSLRVALVGVMFFGHWTELENYITAVERALEYTKQEQEEKSGSLVENWPKNGEIIYQNVCFSYYKDETQNLININFSVADKEKIGIVGRTGCGKTSLVMTMLRLYGIKGRIFIDGVDILKLPLELLRENISVITQEPIIFSGSVRDNIDPSGKYSDDLIWKSLKTVYLHKLFESLDEDINDKNLNLTTGQKQLLSLCRALIKDNKIVILDEVTANLDSEYESLIFNIISTHFSKSTVIIITHKLNEILNCNKVLVMDKGRIVEFGPPSSLIQNKDGIFYNFYKKL